MIEIQNLTFAYDKSNAVDSLSLQINEGEIFALLGPNGSGKSTLLKLLATLYPVQEGTALLLGKDLRKDLSAIRAEIGVVFQSPSLDDKLSIYENLRYQGAFYGLSGDKLKERIEGSLTATALWDRKDDLVETLSGGLKRRVEIAKALLSRPKILLMDEPSTGLDPHVRKQFWQDIRSIHEETQMTVIVATHLMEEADQCDRVAIMDKGQLVITGTPSDLKNDVHGEMLCIQSHDLEQLAEKIEAQFNLKATIAEHTLYLEQDSAAKLMLKLAEAFPGELESATVRKPSLEDVFLHHTGKIFSETEAEENS